MNTKELNRSLRSELDDSEERYLRETLAMLHESYAKAAKPYIDRLVALHSRRVPQMIVTVEQAQALGLMPANDRVEGPGAASSRTVHSHDGFGGADNGERK